MATQNFLWARLFAGCLVATGLWAGCGGGAKVDPTLLASCQVRACQEAVARDADGTCRYLPRTDGTSCSDGDPCTHFQSCSQGVCGDGVHSPDGTPCDDQNACTAKDACQAGRCVGLGVVICPAATPCRSESVCDAKQGCPDTTYPACVEQLVGLPLTGCADNAYALPVTLGNTTLQLLADTGSSTTAVASSTCATCNVAPSYRVGAQQSTYGATSTKYTDGSSWTGSIVQDMALFGSPDAPRPGPAVATRFVAIASAQNNFFAGASCTGVLDKNAYQGILGLGTQAGANLGTSAFFDAYVGAQAAPHDAFAVQLCQLGGKLWVGGYNPEATQKPPIFTPLLSQTRAGPFYAVALDDVGLGQTSLGLPSFSYGVAILDTGTGPLLLPPSAYASFTRKILAEPAFADLAAAGLFKSAQQVCAAPQANLSPQEMDAALPQLALTFPSMSNTAGTALQLSASQSYLTVRVQNMGGVDRYVYCTAVYPANTTTLGAAVLRGLTVVFDRAGQKVGFAPQQGCTGELPRRPSL